MPTIPTVHLNGTSRDELISQIGAARDGVQNAQNLLQKAAPNGRDFYPQGPDAILVAGREHRARLAHLDSVHDELTELLDGVIRQNGGLR